MPWGSYVVHHLSCSGRSELSALQCTPTPPCHVEVYVRPPLCHVEVYIIHLLRCSGGVYVIIFYVVVVATPNRGCPPFPLSQVAWGGACLEDVFMS